MNYRHDDDYYINDKNKKICQRKEDKAGGFRCAHCKLWVVINPYIGTSNRNHCNECLWSKHVDEAKGDRKAICLAGMEPLGLTFKHEGHGRQGELMLIHRCQKCAKISINRIAGDDSNNTILSVYSLSRTLTHQVRQILKQEEVYLLDESDADEIQRQLFGSR